MSVGIAGGMTFMLLPWSGNHFMFTLILLTLAGGLVGSFFSLGLAYAADLLPKSFLAAANVLASFHFNLGSVIGPNISGGLLDFGTQGSMFLVLGGSYVVFGLLGLFSRKRVTAV